MSAEPADWPPAFDSALAEFERHLRAERGLAPRSVMAYVGDVASLLDHACQLGRRAVGDIDLADLRSWLALQSTRGRARNTLARRASGARAFTAWAVGRGLATDDVGASLARPKTHRRLPQVLRADQAADRKSVV